VTPMPRRAFAAAMVAGLLLPSLALAKNKEKSTLPAYVLQARTVVVLIDPNAGISLDDPRANQVAQRDVETSLLNWGRYQTVLVGHSADLVIVIRRGTGKMADGSIHDPRQGQRPGAIDPTDTGVAVGVQRGQPPPYARGAGDIPDASQGGGETQTQNMPGGPISGRPYPQAEAGTSIAEDSFLVYQGNVNDPLDAPPVWRYETKSALKPHTVPAVDAFRKAVSDAEQAQAKQP
jgi:hypothetical protein